MIKIIVISLSFTSLLGLCASGVQAQTTNPAPQRYGLGLGRLLTTEMERTKLDDLRFNVSPPVKAHEEAGAPQISIDGISQRPSSVGASQVTVWLDGRAYLESTLPKGLKVVRNKTGGITGLSSQTKKGKTVIAKSGEMIDRPQTAEEAKAEVATEKSALPAQ